MRIELNNINRAFARPHEIASWNSQKIEDLRMHKIHVYPAKFPAFLIKKSLQHAARLGVTVDSIGDMFCGCGTTALEARRYGKEFYGCDINPVATLIAKVKRGSFDLISLKRYYHEIIISLFTNKVSIPNGAIKNPRIVYWFEETQSEELYLLLKAIKRKVPTGKYRDFYLVAFSNILKRSSRWLTKSIKPTIDKKKPNYCVYASFRHQVKQMIRAVQEVNDKIQSTPKSTIVNKNVLTTRLNNNKVDMLISSPPYVTSYEYADLHQLSTLWLGYAKDFRDLRKGTIGSVYHVPIKSKDIEELNEYGHHVVQSLQDIGGRNPRSVAKYFLDMRNAVGKSYDMINAGGLAVFVIGNTTHNGIYINNAKYLAECMFESGYKNLEVFKRRITSKILTPYRDSVGKFSGNKKHKKIYSYEYVVIGRRLN